MRQTARLPHGDKNATRPAGAEKETNVDQTFLVGAILGSGLFLLLGRRPARVLLAALQQRRPPRD
jgi:hypothetical protein